MDNDLDLKRNHISIFSNIHVRNRIRMADSHLPMVKLSYSKIEPSLFINVQLNQTKKSLK